MRSTHRAFPTVPLLAVAKEISLEDVRSGLEKMPDRFHEHPATVLVITNLSYADAPQLVPRDRQAAALNWQEVRLTGNTTADYAEQIEKLDALLADGWQTAPSPKTGNPIYLRPSELVLFRADREDMLDGVIPKPGGHIEGYDLVLASQPWRAGTSAQFKASRILAPLSRNLAAGGRLIVIQSCGNDPGLEIVRKVWPAETPFKVDRHQLAAALGEELQRDERRSAEVGSGQGQPAGGGEPGSEFSIENPADEAAIFRYHMHTLPSEIGDRIGTSTLFAAWNAAVYVAQIEDERLAELPDRIYREATREVLQYHGGLWFNDETFVVARRR
jgi:hypothetical protein